MKYVVYYELIIIFFLLIIVYRLIKDTKNKHQEINSLKKRLENTSSKPLSATQFLKAQRKNFRIKVYNVPIELTITKCDNPKLQKLIGKKINGDIEDISLSGLKFISEFSLPIKVKFETDIMFFLKNEQFKITALLVRKEEHIKEKLISYGIQFEKMSYKQEKQLAVSLHKVETERK
ncbi:PilZ domain-containing protein [Filobacillus milosensis]|uniref:PilZ domain-containing protein n=1 Tax=Filobacillus milosensis TaxID=94137 RepID=A0A4Y8IV57_9BACI|nr:PilZ domain-containing protein [Filobacillus milosensis]TFB25116.1 PilZ domain-containing protein [Filobacillus milosensis]